MSIAEGLQQVNAALTTHYDSSKGFNVAASLAELVTVAAGRVGAKARAFKAGNCKTNYDGGNLEPVLWQLSLMLGEYIAGILEQKAKDGHCKFDPAKPKPCPVGRTFHLTMLGQFKADLEDLCKQIEDI